MSSRVVFQVSTLTSTYVAPVTFGRSSRPGQNVQTLDWELSSLPAHSLIILDIDQYVKSKQLGFIWLYPKSLQLFLTGYQFWTKYSKNSLSVGLRQSTEPKSRHTTPTTDGKWNILPIPWHSYPFRWKKAMGFRCWSLALAHFFQEFNCQRGYLLWRQLLFEGWVLIQMIEGLVFKRNENACNRDTKFTGILLCWRKLNKPFL